MALTRRQREIYDYVREFIEARGYSPSLEEIGAKFELSSVATVHKHVQHLVEKGWLRKGWNRSRSVEPVERDSAGAVELPLLGVVAAGTPIESGSIDERISVLEALRGGLSECIGCGCLSIDKCELANPSDRAGRRGPGPRYWLG